jgi:gamma-glutamyltranspeptidase/glutathione hydrolase
VIPRTAQRLAATALACVLLAADGAAQVRPAPELASGWTHGPLVRTTTDMVAAANPLAAQAGAAILRAGGTAMDAAVAVQMVLNVVEPQSSGIGGGAFVVHWDARRQRVETYDGRETAPAAATPQLFLDARGAPLSFAAAQIGGRSVGTPGVLRALELAHRDHGRLPWRALFSPAIGIAERGFVVSPRLHTAIAGAQAPLAAHPAARALFLGPDGAAKPVGTLLANPELAATLRAVADGGADAFYQGAIARDVVEAVRSHPTNAGGLAMQDLEAYRAVKRPPVCGGYRGRTICGMGMPSSGTVTLLMALAMLERHDLAALGAGSAQAVHLVTEAYRLAYADRDRYMADSDFVDVPVAGLLDPAYLAQRAALIDGARSMGQPAPGQPPGCCKAGARADGVHAEAAGTSHVSIVDGWGNAVSMTTSIESAFGSHIVVRGFLLNNQLTDFSFAPARGEGAPVANRVEPRKRPRSSMTPLVVFDDRRELAAVLGSPGGAAIIAYVGKTLIGLLDWNLDAREAIHAGNFGAQASATTQLERGTPVAELAGELQARGHAVAVVDMNSGVQAITVLRARDGEARTWLSRLLAPRHELAGAADPRREGVAIGH